MKRKLLALCLCAAMVVGLLAGCTGTPAQEAAQNTGSEKAEVATEAKVDEAAEKKISGEISYAIWSEAYKPGVEASIAAFNEIYPDVTVKLEVYSWSDYWTKLEAAMTGGVAPDVLWMSCLNFLGYADAGMLMPLDDLMASSELFDESKFSEADIGLYTYNGQKYGVAKSLGTVAVWYNKDLFDAAGVEYPTSDWTWEDMADKAAKLTKDDGSVYGIVAGFEDQRHIYNTIYAYGGEIISEDMKTSGYDKAETQQGIQCWLDLIEAGVSPTQAQHEELAGYDRFLAGGVAMLWGFNSYTPKFEELNLNVDCVEIPLINGKRATTSAGHSDVVNASTDNPDAAKAFWAFMNSYEGQKLMAEYGQCPSHKDAVSIWLDAPERAKYNLEAFAAALDYCERYPISFYGSVWSQYQLDWLKKAYAGQIDLQTACEGLAKQMNEALAAE